MEVALLQVFALKDTQRRIVPGGVGAQQDEVCEGTVSPFNDSAAF